MLMMPYIEEVCLTTLCIVAICCGANPWLIGLGWVLVSMMIEE